jgi:Ca2+-binding EF-hand superfamily protein
MWLLAATCAWCGAAVAADGGWNGPQPERIFQKLDVNGDSVVDQPELLAARRTAFARADANHDGYIDEAEVQSLLQGLRALGGAGQRPLLRGRLVARRPAEQANVIARFDLDADGRVSESEFVDPEHPFGARFDGDGDGRITKAEVEKGYDAVRSGPRHAAR